MVRYVFENVEIGLDHCISVADVHRAFRSFE